MILELGPIAFNLRVQKRERAVQKRERAAEIGDLVIRPRQVNFSPAILADR